MRIDDAHASLRMRLLEPVARMCADAGVSLTAGEFRPRVPATPPVLALTCASDDASWDAVVTAVRGHPQESPSGRAGTSYGRDPERGYDLDSSGDLLYEVQIHENCDGRGGHGPRPIVVFRLFDQARAAADELILWTRRVDLFTVEPPVEDPRSRLRRERRRYEHRRAAAATPKVGVNDVPAGWVGEVAALDRAALAFHFPRERSGRYLRRATVALARDQQPRPHIRAKWLVARADGDWLNLEVVDLISANQAHRWDVAPWLWHRHHVDAGPGRRWQVDRPEAALPIVEALRRGAWREAFATAGVTVDPDLGSILDGVPHRTFAAELAGTWVRNLYTGLADLAPWRLAEAHRVWSAERQRYGLPARDPVVLFGLGGLGASRKPKVALDAGPTLRLVYSGGSAVLPNALWTVPADLAAQFNGLVEPE